jgi:hypothetical protein
MAEIDEENVETKYTIRERICVNMAAVCIYFGWAFLALAQKLVGWEALSPLELNVAYTKAQYDKMHGRGASDTILSFYDAYLSPARLIDWM